MLVRLDSVLNSEQLAVAEDLLSQGEFSAGVKSAGEMARREKNNLELDSRDERKSSLDNLVMGALLRHTVYLNAGLPRKIAAPFFTKYGEGMSYGSHIDNPVMGFGDPYRSDLAITLFLNEPDQYDGGELVIDTEFESEEIKFSAGDGVMYSASSRHEVKPVTRGERRVAVTWRQSLISQSDRRSLLYQLYQAKETLRHSDPDAESTKQVDQSYCNLVRMWSNV